MEITLEIGKKYGFEFDRFKKEVYDTKRTHYYKITHFYPFKKNKKHKLIKIFNNYYGGSAYVFENVPRTLYIHKYDLGYFVMPEVFKQEEIDV